MEKLGAAGLLTFQQTQQVIDLVYKGSSNKRLMLPGGTCAVYSYGKLTVAAAETPSAIAAQNYVFDLAELQKAGRLQVELPNGILSLGYFKGSASPLGACNNISLAFAAGQAAGSEAEAGRRHIFSGRVFGK